MIIDQQLNSLLDYMKQEYDLEINGWFHFGYILIDQSETCIHFPGFAQRNFAISFI